MDLLYILREDRNSVISGNSYAEFMKVSPVIFPWFSPLFPLYSGPCLNHTLHFTEKFDYALLAGGQNCEKIGRVLFLTLCSNTSHSL